MKEIGNLIAEEQVVGSFWWRLSFAGKVAVLRRAI